MYLNGSTYFCQLQARKKRHGRERGKRGADGLMGIVGIVSYGILRFSISLSIEYSVI